jgi:hypothetical protein
MVPFPECDAGIYRVVTMETAYRSSLRKAYVGYRWSFGFLAAEEGY